MGGEPLYATLLLGLGIRCLSMPPHQLPEIKRVIRAIRNDHAKALAAEVLALESASDVADRLRQALIEALPDSHRSPQSGGPQDSRG
jgi:phosphotransferase system enzyme I (PtsI)